MMLLVGLRMRKIFSRQICITTMGRGRFYIQHQPLMSQSSDPFYVAKEEIENGLKNVKRMCQGLRGNPTATGGGSSSSSSSSAKIGNDILSEIKQLQYDLQDVETTIGIVEANPSKFKVDQRELKSRKDFLQKTDAALKELVVSTQSAIRALEASSGAGSSSSNAHAVGKNRSDLISPLDRRREMDDFVQTGTQQQKQLVAKQDEQLNELSKCTERLNQTALVINTELNEQARMLTELDEDIDRETEKMNFVMRRLGILMKTSNSKQLWTILILFCVFMFLLMLVIG
ncbi:unnamed protein product [Amoebophrya sp. A120]|nr:unnamed protein product [Amoebophrya sp. A120]|eukprot:GSA120T00007388001.1